MLYPSVSPPDHAGPVDRLAQRRGMLRAAAAEFPSKGGGRPPDRPHVAVLSPGSPQQRSWRACRRRPCTVAMAVAHQRVRAQCRVAVPVRRHRVQPGRPCPAVLAVHGGGGGLTRANCWCAVPGDQVHWIAPSRFGYLRSTFVAHATFDEQAHAYACLLDHLRIERAAVVALSHGALGAALCRAASRAGNVTHLDLRGRRVVERRRAAAGEPAGRRLDVDLPARLSLLGHHRRSAGASWG